MKKLTSILVSAIILITSLLGIRLSVNAATDFSKAVNASFNTQITGNVTQGANKEKDIYKVTAGSNGVIKINVKTPLQADSNNYWRVFIYNSEFDEVMESVIKGNKSSTDAISTGVARGTYYVVIQSSDNYAVKSKDNYVLTIGFEQSEYWEKELNETFSTASYVQLNCNYHGTIDDSGNQEKDYYSFVLPSSYAVTIGFDVPLQADSNNYWRIYLYDKEYNEILSYNVKGNKDKNKIPTIGLPSGTYYLRINSSDNYSLKSADEYIFRLTAEASDFWEKELNEDFASASYIKINTSYYGTTHASGNYENDYYRFDVTQPDSYGIIINTPSLGDSNSYWTMSLYNETYGEMGSVSVKGNTETNSIYKYLQKGTYYIRVKCSDNYSLKSDAVYELIVSQKKKNPLTASGKTVSVKYSKLKKKNQSISLKNAITVKNAVGNVSYSKASGNKKISINKTTGKITVKKGLKKGTYKVKIRVNASGNKVYSSGTKTVTVTIKVK